MADLIAVMWDCNGLEAVANVTEAQKKRMLSVLKGEDANRFHVPNLAHWELRARYNPQRHYEIYLLEIEEGLTVDDIERAFADNPQNMADTVRRIGHKVYSNRLDESEVKIR